MYFSLKLNLECIIYLSTTTASITTLELLHFIYRMVFGNPSRKKKTVKTKNNAEIRKYT